MAARKYSRSSGKDVKSAVSRQKKGTLKSGKGGRGGKVKSRKQAIAIGLSEARKKGKKVPKKSTTRRKSTTKKTTSRSRSTSRSSSTARKTTRARKTRARKTS